MNPVALFAMLGIGLSVAGGLLFALYQGYPILLATLVCLIVAMYVRWG